MPTVQSPVLPASAAESASDAVRPEVIVSAALYLMSSFGESGGCPRLAHVILKHLQILSQRPDVVPVMRSTCAQLAERWESKLAAMLRAAERRAAPTAPVLELLRSLH